MSQLMLMASIKSLAQQTAASSSYENKPELCAPPHSSHIISRRRDGGHEIAV